MADDEERTVLELLQDDVTFVKFLDESFDAKTYANTIIQSRAIGESLAKLSDGVSILDKQLNDQTYANTIIQSRAIGESLAKLSDGVSILDNQLDDQVSAHHEDLLSQATGIETLEGVLQSIQTKIHSLKKSVERVQIQITEPYNRIASRTSQLRRLQNVCDILRRVIRILYLSKRLQAQMKAGVRDIAKAAQSLNELDHVLDDEDISEINVIADDLTMIQKARVDVEAQANVMLEQGLDSQNQTQTGTALQVFYNLGLLQDRIDEVISKYSSALQEDVLNTLDVKQHTTQRGSTQGPGKAAMPVPGNTAVWRAGLWTRMEKLMNKLYSFCEKVFHMERVLAKKKDPISHVCFLENFSEDGRSIILNNFWKLAMETLAEGFTKSAQDSTFIKQAFEGEYPKLLRVCNDLWSRLEKFTVPKGPSSITNQNNDYVIGISSNGESGNSPRAMLKEALTLFENSYLSRSLSRLFDPINLVFPTGAQTVPSKDELNSIVKALSSELNVASVDPDLFILLARNVSKTVQLYVTKCEQLVVNDVEASQLSGGLTNAQILNADVSNSLHQLRCGLEEIIGNLDTTSETAVAALNSASELVQQLNKSILGLLLDAISSSLENKIAKMHSEDFMSCTEVDATDTQNDAQCSNYIKEIKEFILRVENDFFSLYECKELLQSCLKSIAARLLVLFVRHASLIHQISEAGRLKLIGDMAQLELAVTPFCKNIGDLGSAYKSLRAFRPLLFQSLEEIEQNSSLGDSLPYSTVLHFLYSKAPTKLQPPYIIAGWTVVEYSAWYDKHQNENEILALIERSLDSYAKNYLSNNKHDVTGIYNLMTSLLKRAQGKSM